MRRLTVRLVGFLKRSLRALLVKHSATYKRQYPKRKNTIASIFLIVLALPLAGGTCVYLALRCILRGPLVVIVVDIDGEFGHFVEVMERIRLAAQSDWNAHLIMVLSKFRFDGLTSLYSADLKTKVFCGGRTLSFAQQVMLLQPAPFVSIRRFEHLPSNSWMREVQSPIRTTNEFQQFRSETLRSLGLEEQQYVAMAVYSIGYDEERARDQVEKQRALISVGDDLGPVIDHLMREQLDVVLLGSPDRGRAHVPRDILRLADFGVLGGSHEVALAAGCLYMWSDGVGAHWLGVPFLKPVLITNQARLRFSLGPQYLVHLNTYETLLGRKIPLRELLQREVVERQTPYKAASRGEIRIVKNDTNEMIEVHREMSKRVSGLFQEDAESQEIRARLSFIYGEFGLESPLISSTFLKRNSELIR